MNVNTMNNVERMTERKIMISYYELVQISQFLSVFLLDSEDLVELGLLLPIELEADRKLPEDSVELEELELPAPDPPNIWIFL